MRPSLQLMRRKMGLKLLLTIATFYDMFLSLSTLESHCIPIRCFACVCESFIMSAIVYNSLLSTTISFTFNYREDAQEIRKIKIEWNSIDKMFLKLKKVLTSSRPHEFSPLNALDEAASSSTRRDSYGSFMPYLGFIRNTFTFPLYQVISNWSEW